MSLTIHSANASAQVRVLVAQDGTGLQAECLAHVVEGLRVVDSCKMCHRLSDLPLALSRRRPHVCLLSVTVNQLEALHLQGLREKHPACAFAVVTHESSGLSVRHALDMGVDGYLAASMDLSILEQAISRLASGQPAYADHLVAWDSGEKIPQVRWESLSDREREVLRDVTLGLTARECAGRLNISSKTVDAHRRSLQRKLALATPADLTRVGVLHGLLAAEFSNLNQGAALPTALG